MADGKDALPTDLEDGALKPQPKPKNGPDTLSPAEEEAEKDPSEQPS